MKHEEFLKNIRVGLGRIPKREARENLGDLIRSKSLHIWLNYDWLINDHLYEWSREHPDIDFYDGTEGMTFFVCDKNGLPLDTF